MNAVNLWPCKSGYLYNKYVAYNRLLLTQISKSLTSSSCSASPPSSSPYSPSASPPPRVDIRSSRRDASFRFEAVRGVSGAAAEAESPTRCNGVFTANYACIQICMLLAKSAYLREMWPVPKVDERGFCEAPVAAVVAVVRFGVCR